MSDSSTLPSAGSYPDDSFWELLDNAISRYEFNTQGDGSPRDLELFLPPKDSKHRSQCW